MDTATRMTDRPSNEEMARLGALVPLNTLPEEALEELLESIEFDTLGKGKMLFKEGDTDHEHVYLLEGTVVLLNKGVIDDTVQSGSDTARFPLAHQVPRKQSVRVKKKARIARIDSRRLSELLARHQTVDYQVADYEANEDDWMGMLLQSSMLQQVPAANIQQVMRNIEQVEVEKDEDLIRQGEPGDSYYMLVSGRAVVRRDNGDGKGTVELATLGPGDAFGEESLLSNTPRNSTVTMLQDGMVLRLDKEHFLELIHDPLLERLDMKAAKARVDKGAIWLDLRNTEQFEESHLPGAMNFPFESLRYQVSSLAADGSYILYSDVDGRATAGAFLLAERGLTVAVLEGGYGQKEPAREPEREDDGAQAESADPAMQERIHEAERHAKELEERLKNAQKEQESEAAERQQSLQQVRQAVDQARRKLIETEEQKRAALAEKQKAYAEMEQLTGSLEAVENERASLIDRMAEIEGLDKQMQSRLARAERELIGERERAESATSSLADLSGRLTEIMEKRDQEREQHARERGELKEEMTALQMELEQAQIDLEELSENLAKREAAEANDGEALVEVKKRLDETEAAQGDLLTERDRLKAELASAAAQQERLDSAEQQLAELQQALAAREREATEAGTQLQAEVERLTEERDGLQQRLQIHEQETSESIAQLRAELEQLSGDRDALRRQMEDRDQETSASVQELEGELQQLRSQRDELLGQVDSGREQAQELEQGLKEQLDQLTQERDGLQQQLKDAEERAGKIERTLDEQQHETGESIGRLQTELEAARAEMSSQQQQAEQDIRKAQEQVEELQTAADGLREQSEALQNELEQLRGEREQAAAADEERIGSLEQAQARIAELEGMLEKERQQAEEGLAARRAELYETSTELQALQDRSAKDAAALAAAEDRRGELETELAAAQQELTTRTTQLQDELDGLRSEHEQLQSELASGSEEAGAAIEQAHARVGELETRVAEAAEQAQAYQAELESTAQALSVAQERIAGFEQEQVQASEVSGQVESRVRELEEQLDGWRTQANTLRGELEESRAVQNGIRAQVDEKERERVLAVDQLVARQTELDTVQAELTEQREKTALDSKALQEVQAERDEIRAALAAAEEELKRTGTSLQEELDGLRSSNEELQSRLASGDREATDAIEQARARATELETRLEEELQAASQRFEKQQVELDKALAELEAAQATARERDSADAAARERIEQLEAEIERLVEDGSSLRGKLEQDAANSEDALSQLRAEIQELGQRLEERDLALNAARKEQQELIEALNAASSERETLQLALSDRDQEQARLVDLENQVADALRKHENELLSHEQERHQLREQLEDEGNRRRTLQEELDRVSALFDDSLKADPGAGLEFPSAERAELKQQLAARETEVEQLRGVISEYVEQIQAVQAGEGHSADVDALRTELEMVREQAIRDVAQMREQLAVAETQQRRLQQADGREAISLEAMRQQIEALESSLSERQRELGDAEQAQQMLEDSLEDANGQLDELKRDLEKAQVEAEEALFSRREAESARNQLQEALCRLQEDAEEARAIDLRDARLKPSRTALGLDSVSPPSRVMPALLGAGVLLAILEGISFYTGNGELFLALFGLGGR